MAEMKMQLMDQKLRKFKEFMDDFLKDFESGRLSYNMYVTQYEQLRIIRDKLAEDNRKAEDQLNQTVEANRQLLAKGKDEYDRIVGETRVLWSKAHAKFKEVERLIEDADKKRIKESLKGLESVAA